MHLQKNVKYLLKKYSTTTTGLSKKSGVPQPTLFRWENGQYKEPKISTVEKLASWAGYDANTLINSDLEVIENQKSNEKDGLLDNNVNLSNKLKLDGDQVPVISWVAAGSFTDVLTVLKDTEILEWLPPMKKAGKNAYGLIVTGTSMLPKFEPGDRIYVNPDFPVFDLKTNDLVIVSCAGDTQATFKRLIIEEGEEKYLEPLNTKWPEQIIKLTEECKLVGKVVGMHREF
ncbi:putative HTH-type transcriptional regulator [Acinetobacter calcoaceticus]|uniref:Putative HTH-type transcriptional regulator n=1 Tax=Acinetobacter calcoaceticus TaxID=471 RepID=A0A446ZIU6_ACICA|nr:S24 family peptidase [Acinetobacter calcoaceticus]VAX44321.1 putative HTH-type transcriptional regulator [Acinetobacter calcoaceticus]